MARNQVIKLWNVVVTAFLALCTTLGLITTTAAAAVPPTEQPRSSAPHTTTLPAAPLPLWSPWSTTKSLPPTMKQRIRAEAHGKSPSCRHRAGTDTATPQESPPDSTPPSP